jgi:lysophospholipid acyltransferase
MKNDEFYANSAWHVFLYANVSVFLARFKYYFVWKLSMCSVHSSGVSYSGNDFKRINIVDPIICETSMHVREKINNWNISIQEWLRKSIYLRSNFKNKTYNQILVFVVSAFWHGFYAAYYASFVLWFAQVHLQGMIFKYVKNEQSILVKVYKAYPKIGKFVLSFIVCLTFNFSGAYLFILDGSYAYKLAEKLYFAPHIMLFGAIMIFSFMKAPRQKRVVDPELTKLEDSPKKDK